MQVMLACTSHSPLLGMAEFGSDRFPIIRAALQDTQERIRAFDPELVILYGCDHYGGHQMASMPAFCVGVEATALADVGGTPGRLNVPRVLAVDAVNSLRESVDVAVSYAMEVDHGFSFPLVELTGGLDAYPVLPIFVSCLQPPLVPYRRARALGSAVAKFMATLPFGKILVIGTGGLSHNPKSLFPPIDEVSETWRPYILNGHRQSAVPQQAWIDYEIAEHVTGARILDDETIPLEVLSIRADWDQSFLELLCSGRMADFDEWRHEDVIAGGGFGALETLSWVAAAETFTQATGTLPRTTFYRPAREAGQGFGIVESSAVPLRRELP